MSTWTPLESNPEVSYHLSIVVQIKYSYRIRGRLLHCEFFFYYK